MDFTIAKEHYDFFHREGYIEFQEVLTPQQLQEINLEITSLLAESLKVSERSVGQRPPQDIYSVGRDLWRKSPSIKKYLLHKRWARIAAELLDSSLLRIGYDQLIPHGYNHESITTLSAISPLQGIFCGVLFTLESDDRILLEGATPSLPSPTAGNAIFFKSDHPLDLSDLSPLTSGLYHLVVFAGAKTVYIYNETDINTHTMKRLGYVFGDKLNDSLNPILYRRQG